MTLLGFLEAGMLFCFGFAWPFNIYKSYKTRANAGKSLLFLIVIWLGYLLGVLFKTLSPNHDFVLWLYITNTIMVSIDIALYYRNHLIGKHQKETALRK